MILYDVGLRMTNVVSPAPLIEYRSITRTTRTRVLSNFRIYLAKPNPNANPIANNQTSWSYCMGGHCDYLSQSLNSETQREFVVSLQHNTHTYMK